MARVLAIAAFVLALVVAAPAGAAASEPSSKKPELCGIPEGSGAYSFARAWNLDCERAFSVASKSYKKFCEENVCDASPTGGIVSGTVSFNGWDCKVKLGYEFGRTVCEKPGRRVVSEFGA